MRHLIFLIAFLSRTVAQCFLTFYRQRPLWVDQEVEKASHRQRVHPLEFLVHLVQGVEVVGLAEVLALQLEAGLVEDPDAVEVAATTSSEELKKNQ